MRRLFPVIIVFMLVGCTTVHTEATRTTTGEYTLVQTVRVTAGGKLQDGMLDFEAEYTTPTEENWRVGSGAKSAGAETPDIVQSIVQAIQAGMSLAAQVEQRRIEVQGVTPPQPATTVDISP